MTVTEHCTGDVHVVRAGWCQCGHLLDGAKVWALHATYGFPLELSIPALADQGHAVTWERLVEAAMQDGTTRARVLRRLSDLVGDAYPPAAAVVIRRYLETLQ